MTSRTNQQRWDLLTNYAHELMCISEDPDIRIRDLAARTGITKRAVHRIVLELEESGLISHERIGRRNRFRVDEGNRSAHPLERHLGAPDVARMSPSYAGQGSRA